MDLNSISGNKYICWREMLDSEKYVNIGVKNCCSFDGHFNRISCFSSQQNKAVKLSSQSFLIFRCNWIQFSFQLCRLQWIALVASYKSLMNNLPIQAYCPVRNKKLQYNCKLNNTSIPELLIWFQLLDPPWLYYLLQVRPTNCSTSRPYTTVH